MNTLSGAGSGGCNSPVFSRSWCHYIPCGVFLQLHCILCSACWVCPDQSSLYLCQRGDFSPSMHQCELCFLHYPLYHVGHCPCCTVLRGLSHILFYASKPWRKWKVQFILQLTEFLSAVWVCTVNQIDLSFVNSPWRSFPEVGTFADSPLALASADEWCHNSDITGYCTRLCQQQPCYCGEFVCYRKHGIFCFGRYNNSSCTQMWWHTCRTIVMKKIVFDDTNLPSYPHPPPPTPHPIFSSTLPPSFLPISLPHLLQERVSACVPRRHVHHTRVPGRWQGPSPRWSRQRSQTTNLQSVQTKVCSVIYIHVL